MITKPNNDWPEITDEDISWIVKILGLPRTAFCGNDGQDPRLEIIKSMETLDVEACPGSGKTTLLVAKLAVLARKWSDRRRGICVLSHTNVARQEIEERLGNTFEGRQLLSYPHFIGTIHGFVNEFLAIPWLRSQSIPIRMIDDELCLDWRWRKLPSHIRYGLECRGLGPGIMRITSIDFDFYIRWGKYSLSKNTPTYQAIKEVCIESVNDGRLCYDEMFLWAEELLDRMDSTKKIIRERFPILFIDEVQDNSEMQSKLLYSLFMDGDGPAVRQRFGDANQAIFDNASNNDGAASTDPFPNSSFRKDILNTHRFGQEISDVSNPLALISGNVTGLGPSAATITTNTSGKHAMFLFDNDTIGSVLSTYAKYLSELFSIQELQKGVFTAVGAIHRKGESDHLPRSVSDYWVGYDCELAVRESRPRTFLEYIFVGKRQAHLKGSTSSIAENVAKAFLHLISIPNSDVVRKNVIWKHRRILDLLSDESDLRSCYQDLVMTIATKRENISRSIWNERWIPAITRIAEALDVAFAENEETSVFLQWEASQDIDSQTYECKQQDNYFRYPTAQPVVKIKVGSIHSVKGETHTATLVLETYYHDHNLLKLKPWLLGQKVGMCDEGVRMIKRLKQHYVAMTRPSHLLCVAMRRDAFNSPELNQLKNRGWRVAHVTESEPIWM